MRILAFIISTVLALAFSAQKAPTAKPVSLDTVMACQNDALLLRIFRLKASDLGKLERGTGGTAGTINRLFDDQTAKFYGFTVISIPGGEWLAASQDVNQSFCHSTVHISTFKKLSASAGATPSMDVSYPDMVAIWADDPTRWRLDINEIFRHADQFRFTSGIFDDSTAVYFEASKGRVHIQFAFDAGAMRLLRVRYDNDALLN